MKNYLLTSLILFGGIISSCSQSEDIPSEPLTESIKLIQTGTPEVNLIDTLTFNSFEEFQNYIIDNNLDLDLQSDIKTKGGEGVTKYGLKHFEDVGYTTSTLLRTEAIASYPDGEEGNKYIACRLAASIYEVTYEVSIESPEKFFQDNAINCGYINNPVRGGGFWREQRGYTQSFDSTGKKAILTTYVIKLSNGKWFPYHVDNTKWNYYKYCWYFAYPEIIGPDIVIKN